MTQLASLIHDNIASIGLLSLVGGSVVALVKSVPSRLMGWVMRRVSLTVEILSSDQLFQLTTDWLATTNYCRKARRLNAQTKDSTILLSPSTGTHWIWHHKRLVGLKRSREAAVGSTASINPQKPETYVLTVFGRNPVRVTNLLAEIKAMATKPKGNISVWACGTWEWNRIQSSTQRPVVSVVLPAGQMEAILADLASFTQQREWYQAAGIPYHRGYLLYGLPGTGKSSLVMALAGHLGKDVYLVNLAGQNVTDQTLASNFARIPAGSIILLEDIDCALPSRQGDSTKTGVSMGALLNCLDGSGAREDMLVFMTTNHVELLDEALIRPGRIDVEVEFGYATQEQALRLISKLAPATALEDVWESDLTMAALQGRLQSLIGHSGRRYMAGGAE